MPISFINAFLTKIAISIYTISKFKSFFELLKKYSEKIICRAPKAVARSIFGCFSRPCSRLAARQITFSGIFLNNLKNTRDRQVRILGRLCKLDND